MTATQFPLLPITHDAISYLIMVGIIQSFFLGLILLVKSANKNQVLIIWGIFVILVGLISLDLYLCYTGLMQHTLRLNDSSEFLSLLVAPLLYLAITRMIIKRDLSWRQIWPHLIAPGIYLLNMYFFWRQPLGAMYNAYIDAYYPALEHIDLVYNGSEDPYMIKGKIDWWILISFVMYLILSIKLVRTQMTQGFSSEDSPLYSKYALIKNTLISTGIFLVIFIIVEGYNHRDAGDYIIGLMITAQAFGLTYFVLSNSKMLDHQWLADKYDTSGIKDDKVVVLYDQLQHYVLSEAFVNAPEENQAYIAKQLNTSKSYLSRAIGMSDFKNFNDFINHHRIRLAKEALQSPDNQHLTIEAIGKKVGFGSKSAFYNAFKKEVGITPAAYIKSISK